VRFRLSTLGGLSLSASDVLLPSQAQRRRSLALLAIIAASGRGGASVDQILTLLWPDLDSERASNNLKQTKHAASAIIGTDALVRTNTKIRLNTDVVSVDLWDYRDAISAGALEDAVALYDGTFLDGFRLTGVSTFERWLDTQREQIHQTQLRIVESLAIRTTVGDHSLEWWRKLVSYDPLSDRYAEGLMRALARNGDVPAALQVARRHEADLLQELELTPGPSFARLVNQLRREWQIREDTPLPQRAPPYGIRIPTPT